MTQPRLGLVCLSAGDEVRYRTITRTRLRSLDPETHGARLRDIYAANVNTLDRAIDFCLARGIGMYRLTSSMFPQSEESPGYEIVGEFADQLGRIGRRAMAAGLRLVMHPDQYVVLSSRSDEVIANSIRILEHHARTLDLLGQPRSPWAAIELHGGKGGESDRLVAAVASLPDPIRTRLVLENDEKAYGADEILEACGRLNIPMVFDAHHHICHDSLGSYDEESVGRFTGLAAETWPDRGWQMVHISNGRDSFNDSRHSDYITTMPESFRGAPWIEVEAKQKDLAIARLRAEWMA